MAHDERALAEAQRPAGGLMQSLSLVERWAEDEGAKVGPGTVLRRHKALMALARRLGDRTLAEATVGDIEAWLATVGSRTKEGYATAVRSFYTWAVVQQEAVSYTHLTLPTKRIV